jgi:hypothetical protein
MADFIAPAGSPEFDARADAPPDLFRAVGKPTTGPAIVPASSIDRTTMTPAATKNTFTIASRSASTMSSMSAPCVDSISAPRTARKRCTGTATETITSPRSFTRTMLAWAPLSACATS